MHLLHFLIALAAGAMEERPEPSLKKNFFLFLTFVTLATGPEGVTGRITLSITTLWQKIILALLLPAQSCLGTQSIMFLIMQEPVNSVKIWCDFLKITI